jgi:hypothetical protein
MLSLRWRKRSNRCCNCGNGKLVAGIRSTNKKQASE